jgi:hypothetical protein
MASKTIAKKTVDCEQCRYGATAGQTIVCCYYGDQECDPFGQCAQFEPREPSEEMRNKEGDL